MIDTLKDKFYFFENGLSHRFCDNVVKHGLSKKFKQAVIGGKSLKQTSKKELSFVKERFNSSTYAINELMSDMYGKKHLEYYDSIKGTDLTKQYEKSVREHENIFKREINEELTTLKKSAENYTLLKKGQPSSVSNFVAYL